jgi:hypothetical protein
VPFTVLNSGAGPESLSTDITVLEVGYQFVILVESNEQGLVVPMNDKKDGGSWGMWLRLKQWLTNPRLNQALEIWHLHRSSSFESWLPDILRDLHVAW